MTATDSIEAHYTRGGLLDTILRTLQSMGKDVGSLQPADLAPVDEFHVGGRAATIELADRVGIEAGMHVLDLGCGLGGSARYLASERACRVTGIDLTGEYIEAAAALSRLLGLSEMTAFHRGSALSLPFPRASFDVAWTEAAQMNIEDKDGFYAEIARVLTPGGRFAFHDIFRGQGGELHYPVPWANEPSISFLDTPGRLEHLLQALGFRVLSMEDQSRKTVQWLEAAVESSRATRSPRLGLHLLMGASTQTKLENNIRNLREGRFVVIQGVAQLDSNPEGYTYQRLVPTRY